MTLDYITIANHFDGFFIPYLDFSQFNSDVKDRLVRYIRTFQYKYVYKILGNKTATAFISQLTPTIPQNSTLAHWISIENKFRECLCLFVYVETMEILKTLDSALGHNMITKDTNKSIIVNYYNAAIDMACDIRKTVTSDPAFGFNDCPCSMKPLNKYPF